MMYFHIWWYFSKNLAYHFIPPFVTGDVSPILTEIISHIAPT